jgi:hypothetical protein
MRKFLRRPWNDGLMMLMPNPLTRVDLTPLSPARPPQPADPSQTPPEDRTSPVAGDRSVRVAAGDRLGK